MEVYLHSLGWTPKMPCLTSRKGKRPDSKCRHAGLTAGTYVPLTLARLLDALMFGDHQETVRLRLRDVLFVGRCTVHERESVWVEEVLWEDFIRLVERGVGGWDLEGEEDEKEQLKRGLDKVLCMRDEGESVGCSRLEKLAARLIAAAEHAKSTNHETRGEKTSAGKEDAEEMGKNALNDEKMEEVESDDSLFDYEQYYASCGGVETRHDSSDEI